MTYNLVSDRYGRELKVGSFWGFWFRKTLKDPETEVITVHILTDMTGRAMFRNVNSAGGIGELIHTADSTNGLVIDGANRITTIDVMPEYSSLFTAGVKVFMDIEWTPVDGRIIQSPTFTFKPIAQVTTP